MKKNLDDGKIVDLAEQSGAKIFFTEIRGNLRSRFNRRCQIVIQNLYVKQ